MIFVCIYLVVYFMKTNSVKLKEKITVSISNKTHILNSKSTYQRKTQIKLKYSSRQNKHYLHIHIYLYIYLFIYLFLIDWAILSTSFKGKEPHLRRWLVLQLTNGLLSEVFQGLTLVVSLIRSPLGEEFSVNIWGRCQLSIAKNLDSYGFVSVLPVRKANNGWRTRRADHMSPLNWLNDLSSLSVDKGAWGQQ